MEAKSLPRRHGVPLTRSRRMLSVLGDERLVDQVRRGSEAAFEVIYDRHHRGILAFCRHMLGSQEEAEDAVQQTFVNAYRDLFSNDREIRLKAWLFAIARNRCLSILRARREQPAEIPDVPTAGLQEEVQQRAELQELLADLRDLPDEQREALILSEIGDLPHADIARVLEVEPMKVKSLVFQARSSLIETKKAREIPCEEIREQLATMTGGALRRAPLRRHLRTCEGCREYRDQVRKQRAAMAAILPVIPSVGLKESALAAVGLGGGGGAAGGGLAASGAVGGAAAAGMGGGGGFGSFIGGLGLAKIAAVAVLATGGAVGGGAAIHESSSGSSEGAAAEQSGDASGSAGETDAEGMLLGTGGGDGQGGAGSGHDGEDRGEGNGNGKRGERGKSDADVPGKAMRMRIRGANRTRGRGRKKGHARQDEPARSRGRGRGRGADPQRGERGRPVKPPPPARTPNPAPEEPESADTEEGATGDADATDTTTRGTGPKPPKLPDPELDRLPAP